MVLEKCNDVIYHTLWRVAAALALANLLGIAAPLLDEIIDVEHIQSPDW